MEARGKQFPVAKSLGIAEKTQQCHEHFINAAHFLPKDIGFKHGDDTFFLPWAPPNLGTPLVFIEGLEG